MINFRPTYAEINLAHLSQNAAVLRALNPGGWFCPMVKCNAYGHGAIEIVKTLVSQKVPAVGVALTEEGVQLRQSGIHAISILVFGIFSPEAAKECAEKQLTPVVSRWEDLQYFSLLQNPMDVHLKFNTGMNRLGFGSQDVEKLTQFFRSNPQLKLRGVCTHLLQGDDWGNAGGFSHHQLESLLSINKNFQNYNPDYLSLRPTLHILNSAALLRLRLEGRQVGIKPGGPQLGCRPGIALYGAGRTESVTLRVPLKPVMSLRTEIVTVRSLKINEVVSYNAQWKAQTPSRIGVLPIGYGDGISRALSNKGFVLIRGRRTPIIGTICMDYLMVDLTSLPFVSSIEVGEPVTLFGEQEGGELSVDELAPLINTIGYEILTSIGVRIPRRYIYPV
ncbi:MAG: alanine racemase [Bdellovibrionales bacterium]|nr:alanine racemase [Bdellovibrionales bacterium]